MTAATLPPTARLLERADVLARGLADDGWIVPFATLSIGDLERRLASARRDAARPDTDLSVLTLEAALGKRRSIAEAIAARLLDEGEA